VRAIVIVCMDICPTCSSEYTSLGTHFRYSPEHRIDITDKQHEIIQGLLLGDGTIYGRRDGKNENAFLSVTMNNEMFIDYLVEKFGWLSRNKHSSYTNGAEYYIFQTRSHPQLNKYKEWYNPEKEWPEIIITPTILKYLYISDGTYDTENSHNRIMISCSKEGENKNKVLRMFEESGYPVDRTYEYERKGRYNDFQLWFNTQSTQRMFNDMGEPDPGFEYKWPDRKV